MSRPIFHGNFHPLKSLSILTCAIALLFVSCVRQERQTTLLSTQPPTVRAPATSSSININTASSKELETLPGIGAGLALRIIEHRQRYGKFRRPEHLLMVRGLSDRRFREIQPMISVE